MDKQVASHMFEPFYTTRRSEGGTGLGMHIVYNLVTQALGGRINCETHPGAGVHFDIDIPSVVPGE
jgi:signal transduction histidine kinase